MKESKRPTLEKLSWVATIVSLLLSVALWVFPHPLEIMQIPVLSPMDKSWAIVRVLIIANFTNIGVAILVFKIINPKQHQVTFNLTFKGDWRGFALVCFGSIMMAWMLYLVFSMPPTTTISLQNILFSIFLILFFITSMIATLVGLRRNWGLLDIKGDMNTSVKTGWVMLAGLFCLAPLITLATIFVLIVMLFT